MSILSGCMSVQHMHVWHLWRLEKGLRSSGTRVTDGGWNPSCGCWNLNLDPLEDQIVLLTAKSSLQPLKSTAI